MATILPYDDAVHRDAVVGLWERVFGYKTPHNAPEVVIDRKWAVRDGMIWVAEVEGRVVGTVLAGYDGHRGWLYGLAVTEEARGQGLGTALVRHAEAVLVERGAVKINLQIVEKNRGVESFYHKLGFRTEARISMGRVVMDDRGGEKQS